jgi:site-specific DNA recombinase
MRVGIYCRISADKVGAGLGVERQRRDCDELVRQHDWTVVDLYVDNDVSAYSGRPRPQYRRLLTDIAAGRIECIVAWHTDRLHRSPRELEEFIDVCERHNVRIETVRAGELDLRTPAGCAVARTLGAWARYESEHRSERVRRKQVERAENGLPSTGGLRCFGYEKDRRTLVPQEAAVLREAADRALVGDSLRSICADFNRRGIRTTQGNKWATPRLKDLLISPRLAGLLDHHSVGRVRGQWPPILTEKQHARVVALLTDPARRTNPGAPRRRLLGGLLRCGECGNKLSGGTSRNRNGSLYSQYRCAPQEHRGCGKISVGTQPQLSDTLWRQCWRLLSAWISGRGRRARTMKRISPH